MLMDRVFLLFAFAIQYCQSNFVNFPSIIPFAYKAFADREILCALNAIESS